MATQGFDISGYFRRTPGSNDPRAAFVFEGVTGEIIGDFGTVGGGAAGLELDRCDHSLGSPPHTLVLATSENLTHLYFLCPEEVNSVGPIDSARETNLARGDITFVETEDGGAVFSASSISWAGSLSWNGFDNNVSKITDNVLRRFLDPAPF
jgi:N,N-dimethylformamidase